MAEYRVKDPGRYAYKPTGNPPGRPRRRDDSRPPSECATDTSSVMGFSEGLNALHWRKRRSEAFKYNVERYGLPKAKYIAAMITKKQIGLWCKTEENVGRSRAFLSQHRPNEEYGEL